MIHLLRFKPHNLLLSTRFRFSTSNAYIPIRPLKLDRNVLFTLGGPIHHSKTSSFLLWSPFAAFIAQGFINGWGALVIGGSAFTLFLAIRTISALTYYRAHQIRELSVNKNMSKYQLLVPCNAVSIEYQNLLLKVQNKSFLELFKTQLQKGTLEASEKDIQRWKIMEEKDIQKAALIYQYERSEVPLELDRHQIKSISMRPSKQVRSAIGWNFLGGRGKGENVLENYDRKKQSSDTLVIETNKIYGVSMLFYARIGLNQDKKHEEYIQALVENKEIVII